MAINFHHPYTPYDIQETFMKTVYDVLERGDGCVGILESPTGTGKSLSLICATMTWLRDHKRKQFEEGLEMNKTEADEPQWLIDQLRAKKRRELLRQREEMDDRLARVRSTEKALKVRYIKGDRSRKRIKTGGSRSGDPKQDADEEFALDDYESDDGKARIQKSRDDFDIGLSIETIALITSMGMNAGDVRDEEVELDEEVKVYYCSRTHSQLSQFINELRRVKISSAVPAREQDEITLSDDFKHLTLGSRKNLCINPSVSKIQSATAQNERCLELQQPNTAASHKCVFLPRKDTQALVNEFRDHTLAIVKDIEELSELGKELEICPYYASRAAIRPSEVITLPYPLLLQQSAREALGINLKGHVVVVDEAHNLMDAIADIHGMAITLHQLLAAKAQINTYLQKFRNRLKGKNRVYITQLVRLLDSLIKFLQNVTKADGVVDSSELLSGKGVDQINLYKLAGYLQESKLARKVEGYARQSLDPPSSKSSTTTERDVHHQSHTSSQTIQHVQQLLGVLVNPTREGRLFYSVDRSADTPVTTLKYLLLNPSHYFEPISSAARAVILAGGTMSPMADYTTHLFPALRADKLTTLSCGHVIPKANLLAWTLSRGPTGTEFEFTFSKRHGKIGEEMIDELGRAILNICKVVPDGIVVFFSSYAYLDAVVQRWSLQSPSLSSGPNSSLWNRLGERKPLFRESKNVVGEQDVLSEYSAAISAGNGGLLLSVVGGKMSEGINFSDALGRCVVIVGLPFPNIASAEWKAKMTYVEETTIGRLEALSKQELVGLPDSHAKPSTPVAAEFKKAGQSAAREFYENACMRAVNQSIGRAIRHRGDYAAIVMIDKRFGTERIQEKLPGWIREGLQKQSDSKAFAEMMGKLSGFFKER